MNSLKKKYPKIIKDVRVVEIKEEFGGKSKLKEARSKFEFEIKFEIEFEIALKSYLKSRDAGRRRAGRAGGGTARDDGRAEAPVCMGKHPAARRRPPTTPPDVGGVQN